jgi:hypothetical protein
MPLEKPAKLDDLDVAGPINGVRIRLRPLWGVFPMEVRDHSSAWSSPLRSYPAAHLSRDGMKRGATETRLSPIAGATESNTDAAACRRKRDSDLGHKADYLFDRGAYRRHQAALGERNWAD